MAISIKEKLKSVLTPFAKAIGADIQRLYNTKQDKLKAGANINISEDGTISATGAGEAADLSAYSTTEQVTTLVDGKIANFVTESTVDGKLVGFVTENTVNTKLADYQTTAAATTSLEGKQNKLTAGEGIVIESDGTIKSTVQAPDMSAYSTTAEIEAGLDLSDVDLVSIYTAAKSEAETPVSGGASIS